jgi:hypothetical protein
LGRVEGKGPYLDSVTLGPMKNFDLEVAINSALTNLRNKSGFDVLVIDLLGLTEHEAVQMMSRVNGPKVRYIK